MFVTSQKTQKQNYPILYKRGQQPQLRLWTVGQEATPHVAEDHLRAREIQERS